MPPPKTQSPVELFTELKRAIVESHKARLRLRAHVAELDRRGVLEALARKDLIKVIRVVAGLDAHRPQVPPETSSGADWWAAAGGGRGRPG